ncbi:hypothetical protein HID58_041808 [Brassica napus]|uniref:NADH dehydrogenase subunit 6 n=1 Tax=Brassica napus TaxID=3708 RepID=A0ABQ8BDG6_BRANA|nr:hypothetical protein HID58_041808 [Brassica napus]
MKAFLLLRRPASLVAAGRGSIGSICCQMSHLWSAFGSVVLISSWVSSFSKVFCFFLVKLILLSLALLTVVSCLRYPVAPTVFDGLLLSGEEVYAMRLYSFSLDPPFYVLGLLSLILASGFVWLFQKGP